MTFYQNTQRGLHAEAGLVDGSHNADEEDHRAAGGLVLPDSSLQPKFPSVPSSQQPTWGVSLRVARMGVAQNLGLRVWGLSQPGPS